MYQEQFNNFLLNELNSEQRAAVQTINGALLVHAGAGSGKTRVITARIINLLINHAVAPEAIVALTFTNKAAREMKDRIKKFMPHAYNLPFVGTFHSYCLRLLKEHGRLIGLDQFSLIDADDQLKIIQEIIQKNNLSKQISAKQVQQAISLIKNKWGIINANPGIESLTFSTYQAYEAQKKLSKCLDFDDLLAYTVMLLKTKKDFTTAYQEKVRHILVDEYQDTNVIQHELLKCMSTYDGKQVATSVCVVGDEDQSIYSWRGATVENITYFNQDYPGTRHIKIEQNYRSVQDILSVANDVISNNNNRHPKRLWSTKEASQRVHVLSCATEYQEGEVVVQLATLKPTKLSDIAVLYRTHSQSRALEEILLRNSIPYTIVGGIQFYERREIKDLLAYLKLINNPYDRISFTRVLNTPRRKLGPAVEEECFTYWSHEPELPFQEIIKNIIKDEKITGQKKTNIEAFVEVFDGLHTSDNPYALLQTIITKSNYLNYLKEEFDKEEADSKTENVYELMRAVDYFVQQGVDNLSSFLDEVGLMQELMHKTDNQEIQKLQLMTLHAAKGLEFHTVVLTGLEEGIMPSSRSAYEPNALEEERRLAYVGITRAREYLFITHARHRYTYGQMTYQDASRFLQEMPQHLVAKEDLSYWKSFQIKELLHKIYTGSLNHNRPVFTFGKIATKENINSILPTKQTLTNSWQIGQSVNHEVFGNGLIQQIEQKSDGKTHLTIRFRTSIKKLDSSFINLNA
jgi:DNA helicase-2/ATP-dependent DNA helicase PcrA